MYTPQSCNGDLRPDKGLNSQASRGHIAHQERSLEKSLTHRVPKRVGNKFIKSLSNLPHQHFPFEDRKTLIPTIEENSSDNERWREERTSRSRRWWTVLMTTHNQHHTHTHTSTHCTFTYISEYRDDVSIGTVIEVDSMISHLTIATHQMRGMIHQ